MDSKKLLSAFLSQNDQSLTDLLDAIPDAIFFLDPDTGLILSGNNTCLQYLDMTAEEISGRKMLDLEGPHGSFYSWSELMVELIEKGNLLIETQHEKKDGSRLPVEINYTIIKDQVVAISRDISSRKKAAMQMVRADELERIVAERRADLQKANEALVKEMAERKKVEREFLHSQKMEAIGKLAGGVAHDFNNYLTVINGYGEMLFDKLEGNTALQPLLQEILKAGKDAATLTRQLLSVSRKNKHQPKKIQVNTVLTEMNKLLRHVIGEDVTLRLDLSEEEGFIEIDPEHLRQIILNLVVNARDAMPDGGEIILMSRLVEFKELRVTGSYLVISIRDSGVGMSDEVKEHIFEPFFTTKGIGKGTGLGLSTVYGIVKQNGGHILVGTEEDKGTVFDIYFPYIETNKEVDVPEKSNGQTHKSGGETILVVDDEVSLTILYESLLEEQGYKVLTAESGEAALALCQNSALALDALITDVVMTGMTGIDLAEQLLKQFKNLQVIYMSGYMDSLEQIKLSEENVNFLQKPFANTVLLEKVQELFTSSELEEN